MKAGVSNVDEHQAKKQSKVYKYIFHWDWGNLSPEGSYDHIMGYQLTKEAKYTFIQSPINKF